MRGQRFPFITIPVLSADTSLDYKEAKWGAAPIAVKHSLRQERKSPKSVALTQPDMRINPSSSALKGEAMKLSITIEGGMIQSVHADEPVEIAVHFFGDDMSDLRDGAGEQTFKSMDGDDCCIHVVAVGQTAEDREYAARIYDHAIRQVKDAK